MTNSTPSPGKTLTASQLLQLLKDLLHGCGLEELGGEIPWDSIDVNTWLGYGFCLRRSPLEIQVRLHSRISQLELDERKFIWEHPTAGPIKVIRSAGTIQTVSFQVYMIYNTLTEEELKTLSEDLAKSHRFLEILEGLLSGVRLEGWSVDSGKLRRKTVTRDARIFESE